MSSKKERQAIYERQKEEYGKYLKQVATEVDNQSSITSILNHYGIQINRNGQCLCPFHKDTQPSMSVEKNDKYVHCFVDNKTWYAINFIKDYEAQYGRGELYFYDTVKTAIDIQGLNIELLSFRDFFKLGDKVISKADTRDTQLKTVMKDAVNLTKYSLTTEENFAKQGRDYLASRKISPKTIQNFNMGIEFNNKIPQVLSSQKGHTIPKLEYAGLVKIDFLTYSELDAEYKEILNKNYEDAAKYLENAQIRFAQDQHTGKNCIMITKLNDTNVNVDIVYLDGQISKSVDLNYVFENISYSQRHRVKDTFYNRLLVPIYNDFGQPVGFGGRVLDDRKPKYLNTSETEIFHKSNILFNYHQAKTFARNDEIVLVEGYFDVISAYEMDMKNVVATMGVALSEQHIELIKKLNCDVVLCFDNPEIDPAGKRAAIKTIPILLAYGLNVFVYDTGKLGNLKDFGDFNENGKTKEEVIATKVTAFEFLMKYYYFDKKSVSVENVASVYKQLQIDGLINSSLDEMKYKEYVSENSSIAKDEIDEIIHPKEVKVANDRLQKAMQIRFARAVRREILNIATKNNNFVLVNFIEQGKLGDNDILVTMNDEKYCSEDGKHIDVARFTNDYVMNLEAYRETQLDFISNLKKEILSIATANENSSLINFIEQGKLGDNDILVSINNEKYCSEDGKHIDVKKFASDYVMNLEPYREMDGSLSKKFEKMLSNVWTYDELKNPIRVWLTDEQKSVVLEQYKKSFPEEDARKEFEDYPELYTKLFIANELDDYDKISRPMSSVLRERWKMEQFNLGYMALVPYNDCFPANLTLEDKKKISSEYIALTTIKEGEKKGEPVYYFKSLVVFNNTNEKGRIVLTKENFIEPKIGKAKEPEKTEQIQDKAFSKKENSQNVTKNKNEPKYTNYFNEKAEQQKQSIDIVIPLVKNEYLKTAKGIYIINPYDKNYAIFLENGHFKFNRDKTGDAVMFDINHQNSISLYKLENAGNFESRKFKNRLEKNQFLKDYRNMYYNKQSVDLSNEERSA